MIDVFFTFIFIVVLLACKAANIQELSHVNKQLIQQINIQCSSLSSCSVNSEILIIQTAAESIVFTPDIHYYICNSAFKSSVNNEI